MKTVEITEQDIEFIRNIKDHYKVFAEAAERQDETRTADICRRQEFYAERLLARIES